MFLISLRDLQWRRRRVAIAVLGTALVFGMSLSISGLAVAFRNEGQRTIDGVGADRWIVQSGLPGPFTAVAAIPESTVSTIARIKGVTRASPLIIAHETIRNPDVTDINFIGRTRHGLGGPPVTKGRREARPGEVVVDDSLGARIGQVIRVTGRPFTVVGLVHGMTYNSGIPNFYVALSDAQAMLFGGRQLVSTVVTVGVPAAVPPGLVAMSNKAALDDILRPLSKGIGTISMTAVLLWVVAAMIIGSVIYLSTLERLRDFAVLKATGSSTGVLLASQSMQSIVMSVAAGVLAIGIAFVLQPMFPMSVEVPLRDVLLLPVVAVGVGMIGSLSGLRRAVTVEPALAFGGP